MNILERQVNKDLTKEARIIDIADIFQALAQNRPYRRALPGEEILKILHEMTINNKIDAEIVSIISANMDKCLQEALKHYSEDKAY